AHGIGAAIMESCVYDSSGNMLTGTFSDYLPITAMNMPDLLIGSIQTPSPFSFNGAKGMGEGGAAPLHTVCAALQDALFASGAIVNASFNNGASIFEAMQTGGKDRGVKVERRG